MDVTLYAITENKYGEEIYVPLIYFDTLKVSDIEQAADQTSARGGLGNSHQIFWNYNKEITVQLTDALYTPANQSLTWGGYLGVQSLKLNGIWQIYNYRIVKKVVDEVPIGEEDNYVGFICPCDNVFKYYTYECENDNNTHLSQSVVRYGGDDITANVKLDNKNLFNIQNIDLSQLDSQKVKGQLIIKNFSDFSERYTDQTLANDRYCNWRVFEWNDCEGEIITDQETLVVDDINFAAFSNENTDNTMFLVKQIAADGEYIGYAANLNVYKKIYKKLVGLDQNGVPVEKYIELKAHVGNFYIIEDWNIDNIGEKDIPYDINLNYSSVPYLDKIEKISAKKEFKIDTNKNLKAYNAFLLKQYENKNLTCYINPYTMKPYTSNDASRTNDGEATSYYKFNIGDSYLKKTRSQSEESKKFLQTIVRVQQFSGIFKLVGQTYTKDRIGECQHFQIEIPRCKLNSNTSFHLAPDGEPSTVDMTLSVLPDYSGKMISITRYEKEEVKEEYQENYTRPVITQERNDNFEMVVLYPNELDNIFCIPNDCRQSTDRYASTFEIPDTEQIAAEMAQKVERQDNDIPKDLLLLAIYNNNNFVEYVTKEKYSRDDMTISVVNTEEAGD